MTSYPACNKTSLSRKPRIADIKLLWDTSRRSRSLFQNPSRKIAWSAPWGEIMMTSYRACKKTLLSRKPRMVAKSYYESSTGSYGRSCRNRHGESPETPPGGKIMMTSYPACNKTSLPRKPRIPDRNLTVNRLCNWVKWKKYICCFMRATYAINNIYKLISFLIN